jgi:K+-sensing histidine kinase KdpD
VSHLDRALLAIQRTFLLGGKTPPPNPAPVPDQPGQRRPRSTSRTVAASLGAATLSVVFGAVLIPMRSPLGQSVSLLMVLPVLVVALLGGRRLGVVAALAAALTYDVFHTQPYYRPTIDDPDDIVETIVLLAIGITIGYLAESAQRAVVAARIRREELTAVTDFLERVGTSISGDQLAARAGDSITRLLDARSYEWLPGYRGTANPVLRSDGSLVAAVVGDRTDGGGALPATIEIPVGHPPNDHGRFVVRTNPRADVSLEERRAAATIAGALARCIGA